MSEKTPAIVTARAIVNGDRKATKDVVAVCRAFLTLLGEIESGGALPAPPSNTLLTAKLTLLPWSAPESRAAGYVASQLEVSGGTLWTGAHSDDSTPGACVTLGVFGDLGRRLALGPRAVEIQLRPGTPPAPVGPHGQGSDGEAAG